VQQLITARDNTLVDWANRLTAAPLWCGIKASPGAVHGRADCAALSGPPIVTTDAQGISFLQLDCESEGTKIEEQNEERKFNVPERSYEVVHLPLHKLVALSTENELFILTEAEYAAQV
jgi:hypothetical protein